jgi:hypothetical protein
MKKEGCTSMKYSPVDDYLFMIIQIPKGNSTSIKGIIAYIMNASKIMPLVFCDQQISLQPYDLGLMLLTLPAGRHTLRLK